MKDKKTKNTDLTNYEENKSVLECLKRSAKSAADGAQPSAAQSAKSAAEAIAMAVPSTSVADEQRGGGCLGCCIGCCFGIRAAGDYNEGKDISIREWLRFVPFVDIVAMVFNAVDGYNGKTRSDLHAEAPAYF